MSVKKVISVNRSQKKGTIKNPVEKIEIDSNGVIGDAHAGDWNRQISLLGEESIVKFAEQIGRKLNFGEFAENITTSGLKLFDMHPLDKLIIGDIELDVTQIGKKCHGTSCNIFKETGDCVMPTEGIFCRVIKGGIVKPEDRIQYLPKILQFKIVTLSDRASSGIYEDKSGPAIKNSLMKLLKSNGIQHIISSVIIPDDPTVLKNELNEALKMNTDVLFTTGGTGIGPKDITVETIKPMLEKELSGIMDMIRVKYGMDNPRALLSRSIAGTIDQTLVFSLPGGIKAVNEYMKEINKNLLHCIYMVNGIDSH